MGNIKTKIKNFRNSLKRNGIKTEIRRINNFVKYRKTVLDPYAEWIRLNELDEKNPKSNAYEPYYNYTFSFVLEDDTPIKSINSQSYDKWKIIQKDEISQDESDYIIFVGKNIELSIYALQEIVKSIEGTDANLLYGDHDYKIDGKRQKPCFKPDFAIDTLLSRNYIGNFIVIKNRFLKYHPELIENIGDELYYDLVLRISEKTKDIHHISRILFHNIKDDIEINTEKQKNIIKAYLNRNNLPFKDVKDGLYPGDYKIEYLIIGNPKVSIVVPNKDHIDDLKKLIESMKKTTYKNYELIIVENNSEEKETFDYYDKIQNEDSRIKVEKFEIKYFNYSSIVNYGANKASGDYILMLNNDVEILAEDWIEQMLMYAQREDVGICGAKLYFSDDTIQHAGVTIGIRGLAGHRYREVSKNDFSKDDYINIVQDLSAVTAACFLVKKDLYDELLGFDERLAVAFNDVDFCMKVRKKGLLIVYNPFAYGYHYESKSRGEDTENKAKQERFAKEYALFVTRWQVELSKGDPYYNINYRLDTDIPSINYNRI